MGKAVGLPQSGT